MVLLLIQGQVSNLSAEQQAKVRSTAEKLSAVRKEADTDEPGVGMMALALVSAEMAAEE